MYTALMLLLIGIGLLILLMGLKQRRLVHLAVGSFITAGTIAFFWFMGFWGEMLWFESLGYTRRFWEVFRVQVIAGTVSLAIAAVLVSFFTRGYSSSRKYIRLGVVVVASLAGMTWGTGNWENILRFLHAAPTEMTDPIFHKPVGFYFFTLPLLDAVNGFLLLLAAICLAANCANAVQVQQQGERVRFRPDLNGDNSGGIYRSLAFFFLVMAYTMFLQRLHLMYSEMGAVTGPGWTDVHIRLPALMTMLLYLAALAVLNGVSSLRNKLLSILQARFPGNRSHYLLTLGSPASAVVLYLTALTILPTATQRLAVEPNEITFERPYIAHNIRMTRHGFRLQSVEEREFPAADVFTPDMVERNRTIFDNVRLWDYNALQAVFKQFQEIRLYYEFKGVDIDRYLIDGRYSQVMVSAREMQIENIPAKSQTFVNQRFKYTHGHGMTMTNVSTFTEQGLPDLLIRDIPARSRYPELEIQRPEIYYGELTTTPVLVNTKEEEFDYPAGEKNAYTRYQGSGGVRLSNLRRKFLYGWKFDGIRLFLSSYPTPESRILFHRQIKERAALLAPFLQFDDDPYIVLADGKMYWILDAYTTSAYLPYSERFLSAGNAGTIYHDNPFAGRKSARFQGSNYVRNSVKVVVDAYEGAVDFYIFDENDPLIQTWKNIFPDMFQPSSAMPASLQRHVRYPTDMLLLQGLVYAKYHMTEPNVFYNQEDLWVRATEKYAGRVRPVEPYYIMWELPGSDHPEFVLMLPFTPKNRQVSIGWIAAMCDGEQYGRLLAYMFPKEKRVLGPQQVETKIDQDRFLASRLTLWDQRGSRVIRGNVLAIPVEDSLLYVEPIYLQAETAAYPELRLVALMHDDTLSYAESFDKALQGLFEKSSSRPESADPSDAAAPSLQELSDQANTAFEAYLQALGDKRFQDAGQALQRLESSLKGLSRLTENQDRLPVEEPEATQD